MRRTDVRTLRFRGPLTALAAEIHRSTLDEIAEAPPRRLVIDLANVSWMDASGVTLLVALYRRVHRAGGTVVMLGLQGQPAAILQALDLPSVLPIAA